MSTSENDLPNIVTSGASVGANAIGVRPTRKEKAIEDIQEEAKVSFSTSLAEALTRLSLDNLEELRVAFCAASENAKGV